MQCWCSLDRHDLIVRFLLCPAPRLGALSDYARLTSVYLTSFSLSRTSGLSRSQRGPGRPKIDTQVAHVTRDSDTTFKFKKSKVNLQGAGAYCGSLPHSLLLRLTTAMLGMTKSHQLNIISRSINAEVWKLRANVCLSKTENFDLIGSRLYFAMLPSQKINLHK